MKKVLVSLAFLFALCIGKVAAQEKKVTVTIGGKDYTLCCFENCEEYKAWCIDKLGTEKGNERYKKDNCRNGIVQVVFPSCAKDFVEKNQGNAEAMRNYYIELVQLGDAAFCKKYGYAAQQVTPMRQDKVKKQ